MPEIDIYSGLLRMSGEFQKGLSESIAYATGRTNLSKQYPIAENDKGDSDMKRAVAMLAFISDNMFHNGSVSLKAGDSARDIMDYSFAKGRERGVNCMALSSALTECLAEIGIPARTVFMMPASPYDADNHVVTEAWLSDKKRWIMLDPTYKLYAYSDNEPLCIMELRTRLAKQESVYFGEEAAYNGARIDKDEILRYYAKDMYWFQMATEQGGKKTTKAKMLSFAPIGYDVKAARLANIDFRIGKFGKSNQLLSWRNSEEKNTILYGDIGIFAKSPY